MSDSNVEVAADGVTPPAAESAVTLAALQTSVRRHRIWLILLTVFAVVALCGVTSVVWLSLGIGEFYGEPEGVSAEQVSEAEQEIEVAYGERLESVEVRAVEVNYGEPFPYSLMAGDSSESLYIEYRLKDSDVLVADLLESGMYGDSVSESGILPMKGSLFSQMPLEKFERLLVAYGAQTKTPLGSVRRYTDSPYFSEMGEAVADEVTVGDTSYPTKELWSASEGRVIEGDSIDMSDEMDSGRSALVFREDAATGEFVYLGTEPAEPIW